MVRSRHRIIGPDDPTISYKVNIYALFHRAIKERVDSLQPHRLNRYVYCNNNPVNFTDPLGLQEATAIADTLRDFAAWRTSDPDLAQYEPLDWAIAGLALAAAAVIAGDIDLPHSGIPTGTIETGGAEGIPWSQEDAESIGETLDWSQELPDWMPSSEDRAETSSGEEGPQAEVGEKGENGTAREVKRGSRNEKVREAIETGKNAHKDFAEKVKTKDGWKSEPTLEDPQTGKKVRPDAVTKNGKPVELKPRTPSGQAKGKAQLPKYERATGQKGRVITYEPDKYKY